MLVARVESFFEMHAAKEMLRTIEPPVDADRGATPGGPVAGEILVTRVHREPRAALEQASFREGFAPLARPGGRRKLLLSLGEKVSAASNSAS